MIHRWRYYRLFLMLPLALLLVLMMSLMTMSRRNAEVSRVYLDDTVYAHLAVADNLLDNLTYGIRPGEHSVAGFDPGWRILLALTSGVTGDSIVSAYLLGMIFSIITMLVIMRMSRKLFPFLPFGYFAAALLILAPGLVGNALSGTSASMAACLITLATLLHMDGIKGTRSVLPLTAASVIGIAVWLRIEFIMIWALFIVHAMVLSAIPHENRPLTGAVLLRGINGFLIISLFALPLFAWNMWIAGTPWPRLPGVPMAIDAWGSDGSSAAFSGMAGLAGTGWFEALDRLGDIPVFNFLPGLLFTAMGIALILVLSYYERENRPFTLAVFVVLVLPVLYAIAYPYVGWFSADLVMQSVHPFMVIVAAYGVVRLPFALEKLFHAWRPRRTAACGFRIWWGVAGGILLITGLLQSVRDNREDIHELLSVENTRGEISSIMAREVLFRDTVVTDEPGWPVYRHGVRVIDLSGQFSTDILSHVDDGGRLDPDETNTLFKRRMPGTVLLWNPEWHHLVGGLPEQTTLLRPDDEYPHRPLMTMVTWPGVL